MNKRRLSNFRLKKMLTEKSIMSPEPSFRLVIGWNSRDENEKIANKLWEMHSKAVSTCKCTCAVNTKALHTTTKKKFSKTSVLYLRACFVILASFVVCSIQVFCIWVLFCDLCKCFVHMSHLIIISRLWLDDVLSLVKSHLLYSGCTTCSNATLILSSNKLSNFFHEVISIHNKL